MFNLSWLKQLQAYAICMLAFAIPFNFIYSSVATIVVCLLWLLQVKPRDVKNSFGNLKILWFWVLLYGLHVLGWFHSSNKDHASFDLQVKLGMLILPIVIGTTRIDTKLLERIFLFFTFSITAVSVFCITRAGIVWGNTGETTGMFYHALVDGFDANAVYMAWYAAFSLSLLLFFPWPSYSSRLEKVLRLIQILLQVVFFILLSSRMLILLFFVFIVPLYLLRNLKLGKPNYLKITIVTCSFFALAYLLLTTDNPVKKRYQALIYNQISLSETLSKDYYGFDASRANNLNIRFFIWKLGLENMRERNLWLTGAGTGDVYDLQNAKFRHYQVYRIDYDDPTLRSQLFNINMHNMFFQCLLMLGLPGLLVFSLITFAPFVVFSFLRKHIYFLAFFVISTLFLVQEAALQSQAGTLYYSLFSIIFWRVYSNEKQNAL